MVVNAGLKSEAYVPIDEFKNDQGEIEVEPGSPADDMGLVAGDLIISLNGKDTDTAQSFGDTAKGRPDSWRVVLQRGGRTIRAEVSG